MKTLTSPVTRAVRSASANQAPQFSDGASTLRTVMENAAADANVGGVVFVNDANGDALAYTLGGSDAAYFSVISAEDDTTTTGVDEAGHPQIRVKSTTKLDHETRSRYNVTITANDGSDASNATATIAVAIHIIDVDEAPKVAGPETVNYAENSTGRVARFTASDPEGATPIVWSVVTEAVDLDGDNNDILDADVTDSGLFKIGSDGSLEFRSSPNFEAAAGGTGDNSNTYMVTVGASDGATNATDLGYHKVLVSVTNVDEPGKVTWTVAPVGTTLSPARSLRQFFSGATLTASVTDGDGAVGTAWKWYRGSSEISGETATTYTVTDDDVGMRIRAEASYREDANSPIKRVSLVSENVVLATRTATNNAPQFASAEAERRVAENASAGDSVGGPLTATDDDGDVLTYSIPAATENFEINATTGRLTVKDDAELNHDAAEGDDQDITVTVNDPAGAEDTIVVTVLIADVNEAPAFAETTETVNVMVDEIAENVIDAALQVGTYTATDPDDDSPSISLMGPDADMFQHTADSGDLDPNDDTISRVVSFKASPDFEMPGDSNRDNVYELTVRASDGSNHKDMAVIVKVTNVNEIGEVKLSSQDAQMGVELTATLSDDDGGPNAAQIADQSWTWHRLAETDADNAATADNAISGAKSATYTPTRSDSGMVLKAMVSYTDRYGMQAETSDATRLVRAAAANQAPKFNEGASAFRIVMENAKPNAAEDETMQGNVGGPIIASDVNGDALSYSLGGADADLFKVDQIADNTGTADVNENFRPQIEVKSGTRLDYETKSNYSVTLTANDGSGASDATATIMVTIYVVDVDEKPTIMVGDAAMGLSISGPASVSYTENGRNDVGTYTVAGANAASATWSLEGVDDDDFSINGGTLSFNTSPDYEMADDSDGNNVYMVTVKASDGTYMDTLAVTVTVTDEDEGEVDSDALRDTYDINNNGQIDRDELREAIIHYIEGDLQRAELRAVIILYIRG